MFGLTVGENSKEEANREVYQRNIVYGTAHNFQGDILRTEFSGEDIRGGRGFGVVIIDEADHACYNDRNTSVMLSSPTPGMHHLEPVLAATWSYVNMLARQLISKGGKTYFITEKFKVEGTQIKLFSNNPLEACMFEVKGQEAFLQKETEEHLRKSLRDLSTEERQEREALQSIEERITILGQEISTLQQETSAPVKEATKKQKNKKKLKKIDQKEKELKDKEAQCKRLEQGIQETAWKKNGRDEIIAIPNYLKDFARHQLPYWVHNAIYSLSLKKEVHYDVKDGRIVPIDYANTGVLQESMVWSDGLTQMLQVKEGLRFEPENLSNNVLPNVAFLKRYAPDHTYGMSGTLGGAQLQQFFEKVYNVDVAIIPPYKVRPIEGNEWSKYVCKELPAIITTNPQDWNEAIVRTTLQKAKRGRAVLVLCQFIEQVKQLEKLLRAQYKYYDDIERIFTYTGQATFHKHEIDEGKIIIATNISGRGTDLKTSDNVERNGGMHVCMTFLPVNDQVERQNAGRTAREGKTGTAQLVLYDPDPTHTIEYLRARRDAQVDKEIQAAIKDVQEMLFRDNLFTKFCALENEFFPSASEQTKIEQSQLLNGAWEKLVKQCLTSENISKAYQGEIAQ